MSWDAGPVTEQPGKSRRGGPACPPRRGQPHRVAPTLFIIIIVLVLALHGLLLLHGVVQQRPDEHRDDGPHGQAAARWDCDLAFFDHPLQPLLLILADLDFDLDQLFFSAEWIHGVAPLFLYSFFFLSSGSLNRR